MTAAGEAALQQRAEAADKASALNRGHGHVHPRPDGVKARCGGPRICSTCAREALSGLAAEAGVDPDEIGEGLTLLPEPEPEWETPTDPEDDVDEQRIGFEVVIAGKHVDTQAPPKPCGHRQVQTEVSAAMIVDDEDTVIAREVMLRAVCGECGVQFEFDVTSARESRTHGATGLVALIAPTG